MIAFKDYCKFEGITVDGERPHSSAVRPSSGGKMKLSEFLSTMRGDITGFANDWLSKGASSPAEYPFELELGEWIQEFKSYLEGKYNDLQYNPCSETTDDSTR